MLSRKRHVNDLMDIPQVILNCENVVSIKLIC